MPYNQRMHVGKWGSEIITLNARPIVVPRQPIGKRRFSLWVRMLKRAKGVALLGSGLRYGFAVPPRPPRMAPLLERREWFRWERAAYLRAFPPKLRRAPDLKKYAAVGAPGAPAPTSPRELELVADRARGLSIGEMAAKHGVAKSTLHSQLRNAEQDVCPWLFHKLLKILDSTRSQAA